MSDKVLVIILAGRSDMDRAKQGLTFTRVAKKMNLLSDVKLLFFGPGVQLLDPEDGSYAELRPALRELTELGVQVSACVSNVAKYGLGETLDRELVVAEEAAALITDHVKRGYQLLSF